MREQDLLKLSKNSNRGITLIALVITIIVLLILAGVSIAMLTGENGILTQASTSKERTERAEAIERAKLDIMAWRAEELSNGRQATVTDAQIQTILTGKEYVASLDETSFTTKEGHTILYSELYTSKTPQKPEGDTVVVGQIVTGQNADYTTEDGTAKIPVGFAIVPGLDDISEGLVISDEPNDTTNSGNQFVWIPVNSTNPFQIRAGYAIGSQQDISAYGEANSTGANTNSSITETPETQAEAIAMYQSVADNGGFYIGRYEAGKDAEGNVVCKKGAAVYNNIGWNDDTTNDSITNEEGGAVELARKFAEENGYDITKVHSTLCYSVQWDTALNFIDPGYTGYAKDSSNKGWYSDNYNSTTNGNTDTNPNQITGKDLIYTDTPNTISNAPKNIYDMGGNVWEWTMEACYTIVRATRGGGYDSTGSDYPASHRGGSYPSYANSNFGFRLALYL